MLVASSTSRFSFLQQRPDQAGEVRLLGDACAKVAVGGGERRLLAGDGHAAAIQVANRDLDAAIGVRWRADVGDADAGLVT